MFVGDRSIPAIIALVFLMSAWPEMDRQTSKRQKEELQFWRMKCLYLIPYVILPNH